jgi:hypothetical protein
MNNTLLNSQPEIPLNTISEKSIESAILVQETISDAKAEKTFPEIEKIIGRSFFGYWQVTK